MIPAHDLAGPEGAPVLVLPSSLGTTRELWAPQLELFARELRVLRYDQRGHGESPVPSGPYAIAELGLDALALLDALGLERVLWCGLSLGGMVGMWLGAHAPERLDALVLACTSARVGAPEAYAERGAFVRAHGIEPVADAVLARWLTPATLRDRPKLAARLRDVLVAQPVEGYAGCCDAIAAWDFRTELPDVAVPTLVLAGAEDEATPAADTELLATGIRGATRVVLEGAGHLANLERPAELADAVLAHVLARA